MEQSIYSNIQSINQITSKQQIPGSVTNQFTRFLTNNKSYTKTEGNPHHYCTFFLPFNRSNNMIYLGHHKKANDWLPPGGHIEPGESTLDTIVREMKEELDVSVSPDQLEPFSLSVKKVDKPHLNCLTHYDIWYLVHTDITDYTYDKQEYHQADWFNLEEGLSRIQFNDTYKKIISTLR